MSLKTRISRHPVLAFIVLTLAWSWTLWSFLFLFIEPGELLTNAPPISFLFVLLGGVGPTLFGLLLTLLIYGREGIKGLWARLDYHPIGRWWWALLVIPCITAITPLLRWLAGYEIDSSAMVSLLLPGIALGLVAGLMEEFGWRGFLLPHLLKRYTPLVATLLLGAIWGGLWHGYGDYFALGGKGWYSLALILLLGPVLLTAWSFIITWVYEQTRANLLLSILMHASLSSSAFILGQTYATPDEELVWTAISVGVAWLGAIFIWFVIRRPSARPLAKPRVEPAAAGVK